MSETPRELRALAAIVKELRPSWPVAAIEQALVDDIRDLDVLTRAAVAAATNTSTRHPQGIRTTFPGADECTVCAQRQKAEQGGPEPVEYCKNQSCRRMLHRGETHVCVDRENSGPPGGWHDYQAFLADTRHRVKQLRNAIANDPDNIDLSAANLAEIRSIEAEIQQRANNIQPQAQVTT